MSANVYRLTRRDLPADAHLVAFRPHHCELGNGYRAECTDCNYVSPVLSWRRAQAVADEHARKSVDVWKAAR